MEDFFWVMVVIFFVVAPMIEKILKRRTRGQPPAGGLPQQRRPLPRPQAERDRAALDAQASRAESRTAAAGMLPAELWEVLTGQRPMPLPPAPGREEAGRVEERSYEGPGYEETDDDERLAAAAPPPARVERRDEEAVAGDLLRKRQREQIAARYVEHKPPAVVSLESAPRPARQRHAAFHARVDPAPALAPPPRVPRAADAIAPLLQRADRNEIRRAILMREVLGPPRGLE